ncbi:MAG: hypothetical protein KAW09_04990, partial [Thermoplasmata archaeon]|nr:hypothetical protein [Thermoplasmata archaeon]
ANTAPEICSFIASPSTEGTAVEFTVYADDAEDDPLTYSFDFESDGIIDVSGSEHTASNTWYDDHTGTATVYVSDGDYTAEATAPVIVVNAEPNVMITGPQPENNVYPVNTPVTFTGEFTDAGTLDTHTAEWTFDDITIPGTVTESDGIGSVTDIYTFDTAGVYLITLTVTDDDGGVGTANTVGELTALVVIYDPTAGHVTGGGWFESPPGALAGDSTVTGRAGFGFFSKYDKGADVPKGSAEFRFHAGDIRFHSTSYDWLVVAGFKAMFKGEGKLNGEEGYGFLISAIDGDLPGGDGVDKFRIKIWDLETEEVIYDNNPEGGEEDDPITPVVHGQIKINR